MLSGERRAGWVWVTGPPPGCFRAGFAHFCFLSNFCPRGASPVGRELQRPAAHSCVEGRGGARAWGWPNPARMGGYHRGARSREEMQGELQSRGPPPAKRVWAQGSGQPRAGSLVKAGDRAVGVTSQRPHCCQKAAEQRQRLPARPCNRQPRRCLQAAESVSFQED